MKQAFLLVLLISLNIWLNGQNQQFARSVELLNSGNPIAAIAVMDSILSDGYASTELYSNLGNAHFAQGNKAKSILYYEKALILSPSNNDIMKSIDAVRRQLDIQITDIPDFILVGYYRNVVNLFSASTWGMLQLLSGLVAIGALFLYFFPRSNINLSSRSISIIGISALVLSLLFLAFAHSKKGYELSQNQAVVMASNVSIHQAPDKLSPEVAPLGEGNKVFIVSELGDWYKVSLRDKDTGWIKKEEVAII